MDRCWASLLGDCDGPLSDEHIVSAGLLPGPKVNVSGFDWCKGMVREIPRDRLVRRILCRGHNGRLSPYDSAAIGSARLIDEWQRLEEARTAMKPRRWTISHFEINGIDLERWLLKTTINSTFDKDVLLGPSATEPGKPPEELIRIAFGKGLFSDKRGLYVLAAQGYTANVSDRISLVPWGSGEVVNGMAINFRGFTLFLCLVPSGLSLNDAIDTPLQAMDPEQKVDRMKLNPMYHPKAFVSKQGDFVSSKLIFNWKP